MPWLHKPLPTASSPALEHLPRLQVPRRATHDCSLCCPISISKYNLLIFTTYPNYLPTHTYRMQSGGVSQGNTQHASPPPASSPTPTPKSPFTQAREAQEVDQLCSQLEGLGGPVLLRQGLGDEGATTGAAAAGGDDGGDSDSSWPVAALAGTWRLVYSSGFNNGTEGYGRGARV